VGKRSGPRRGSLAFYPRKRAKRIYPNVNRFKETNETKILGFPVYKAGMTRIVATDVYENSPSYGKKVSMPVTILEAPPVQVISIRFYEKTPYGLNILTEVLSDKIKKNAGRVIKLPKKYNTEEKLKEMEQFLEKATELRVIVITQPDKIKLKKTPEVMEFKVGGDLKEAWEHAKSILGKEVHVNDLFKEGEWIDVSGVTKGKGTQGPVKRFGIKIQSRKVGGHRRMPGAIGAWTPSRVLYTVPMAGQHGFQTRTELNKRIIKIGEKGEEVTPKGGIVNYGVVRGTYILVKGSVPGPKKRLLVIREAIRGKKETPLPSIEFISKESQKG